MLSSQTYRNQAKMLLENTFPRVSCKVIDIIFRGGGNYNFATTFHLISAINNSGDGAGQFHVIPKNVKVFIKADRPQKQFEVNDKELLAELENIPELPDATAQLLTKTLDISTTIDLTTVDEKEEEKECLCCFGDYPLSSLKQCSSRAGHLVCTECIQRFVSEQLDGNGSTNFQCIGSDECPCKYSQVFLDGVLTPKLRKRVNEKVFQEEVSKALGGEDSGLWKCPKCTHMGYTDKKYPWIYCPECKVSYCTSCNEQAHGKQTCEEIRSQKLVQRDPKHLAHEVMSRACKRSCPNCHQEFMKDYGCNKMKCIKCKTFSCYLCGSKLNSLKPYRHFCNCKGKFVDQVCTSTSQTLKIWRRLTGRSDKKLAARHSSIEVLPMKIRYVPSFNLQREKMRGQQMPLLQLLPQILVRILHCNLLLPPVRVNCQELQQFLHQLIKSLLRHVKDK